MVKNLFYAALVLLFLAGCSSNNYLLQMSAEEAMLTGDEYFARKKFNKAIPYYQKIVNEANSALIADAQMKLADSFFERQKYIDARFEYEEFIRRFSDAREVAKAFFQIGVCYYKLSPSAHYDQQDTFAAIDAFSEYLERFPFDERKKEALDYINKCRYKLLEKKYYNGYAYYKISDYPSAFLYFNEIIELDNLNEIDKKSRYYCILMYIYREDLVNAQNMAEIFYSRYADSRETAKVQRKIERLEKKLQKSNAIN